MPELPEVETVRRGLEKTVVGHRITAAEILLPKAVHPLSPAQFEQAVAGRIIESVGRRGKYLLFSLSGSLCLVAHLRMTGCFSYVPDATAIHPHTRIILQLDHRMQLRFMDMRTFGGIKAVSQADLPTLPGLNALGPEPLSAEFNPEWLYSRAAGRAISIKGFLLDQRSAAGIGNIYADESLHLAGIHPERSAGSLTLAEWTLLCEAIQTTMAAGIRHRGTSVQNYQNLDGRPGAYQDRLQVYQKTGLPCSRCGTAIEKIRVAGRGTHFCPVCQPLSPSSGNRRR
jgi:formamidopyrimidine-DNA glycosylase